MDDLKRKVGFRAVEFVKDGMTVGLGTGSTAHYMILALGERAKQGLKINCVATSLASEKTAKECGLNIVEFKDVEKIDLSIDGADEIDLNMNLIKGGGGALLREKIIENFSEKLIIIADESKNVELLGDFKVPVEVTKFASELTAKKIEGLGGISKLRVKDGQTFITDNGNYIYDCDFGKIENPKELCERLNMIPGVVENGIFPNMADTIIIAHKDGKISEKNR